MYKDIQTSVMSPKKAVILSTDNVSTAVGLYRWHLAMKMFNYISVVCGLEHQRMAYSLEYLKS